MCLAFAFLLEVLPNASQCSTSSSRTNKAIQLSLCLLPNFRACGCVVSTCIGSVVELVCPNGIWKTLCIFSSLMIIVLGILKRNGWDGPHISTEHKKEIDFFLTLGWDVRTRSSFSVLLHYLSIGHVNYTFVAFCSTDVGEANASISCCAFDNCTSRFDSSSATNIIPGIPDGKRGRTSLCSPRLE